MSSGTHGEAALQELLEYTESIVNTVREPLLVLSGDLRVVTASHSFYQTFAVAPGETIGRFVYDLGNKQWDIPKLRTLLEEVLPAEKSFHDFEVVHEFPSIGKRVMLLNGRKLWRKANATEHILLAIEDVTERKRIADDLIRSNEELQSFAYIAAHDLRSPLNSGITLLQLIARRASELKPENAATLQLAITNFGRLGALMEDVLEYSTAANAPLSTTLVDLTEPLNVALANLRHHLEANEATVRVEPLPTVPAYRTHMVIVFQNLIGNAIKYRREDPPRVSVAAVQQPGYWEITIADNGRGFDPVHAQQIFEPFKRLHGKDIPGSGIGLATSKRIIDRLGGRIWAESVPGTGSVFHFTLAGERGPRSMRPA
jgi:signal transduction histidine kinase